MVDTIVITSSDPTDTLTWLRENVGEEITWHIPISKEFHGHPTRSWAIGAEWVLYLIVRRDEDFEWKEEWANIDIVEFKNPEHAVLFALKFG